MKLLNYSRFFCFTLIIALLSGCGLVAQPSQTGIVEKNDVSNPQNSEINYPPLEIKPYQAKIITAENASLITQLASLNYRPPSAWLPNSNILVASPDGSAIDFWTVTGSSLEPLRRLDISPYALSISNDRKYLASAFFQQNDFGLYKYPDGSLLSRITGHSRSPDVTATAFSPENDLLATGSGDTTIRLWQLPDANLIKVLEGHTASISSIAFSPDGKLLVSGSQDGTVRLWRVYDGAELSWGGVSVSQPFLWAFSVAFSPDGKYIAAGGMENGPGFKGMVRVWNASDRTEIYNIEFDSTVGGVAFSSKSDVLAVNTSVLWLLRVSDGSILAQLNPDPHDGSGSGAGDPIVSFSPNGELIASCSGGQNFIYVWGLQK